MTKITVDCLDCKGKGFKYIACGSMGDDVDLEECENCGGTGKEVIECPEAVAEHIQKLDEQIKVIDKIVDDLRYIKGKMDTIIKGE